MRQILKQPAVFIIESCGNITTLYTLLLHAEFGMLIRNVYKSEFNISRLLCYPFRFPSSNVTNGQKLQISVSATWQKRLKCVFSLWRRYFLRQYLTKQAIRDKSGVTYFTFFAQTRTIGIGSFLAHYFKTILFCKYE